MHLLLTSMILADVLADEVFGPIICLPFCYKEMIILWLFSRYMYGPQRLSCINWLLTWMTLDDVFGDEVFRPIIFLAFCCKEKWIINSLLADTCMAHSDCRAFINNWPGCSWMIYLVVRSLSQLSVCLFSIKKDNSKSFIKMFYFEDCFSLLECRSQIIVVSELKKTSNLQKFAGAFVTVNRCLTLCYLLNTRKRSIISLWGRVTAWRYSAFWKLLKMDQFKKFDFVFFCKFHSI